ncbi:MAG: helix-turn-helix domain-containing protein [Yoonia sp.]|jgi:DNA-binding transcriptional MerR regulator|nr:helix-turn-helix domain-containing protein [Yoonia sp.]
MANFTIGQASDASHVKVTTIRFYEDRGLLGKPPRTASGRRIYDATLIARLRFIRHARDLGFSLDDIGDLLALSDDPTRNCSAADSIAQQQLHEVRTRIAQLKALEAELSRMVTSCGGGAVVNCQVIESLADHAHCASDHPRS